MPKPTLFPSLTSLRHVSRRELLNHGAWGTLGLLAMASGISCAGTTGAAPRNASAASDPSRRKLGVALLGLGDYASSQLAPALQKTQNCALRGIVTGTPSKVDIWKRKYSIPDTNVYDYTTLPRIANNTDSANDAGRRGATRHSTDQRDPRSCSNGQPGSARIVLD